MRMVRTLIAIHVIVLFGLQTAHSQWVHAGGPMGGGNVTSVITAAGNILAATSNGLLRSTDNGATWVPVGTGFSSYDNFKLSTIGPDLFAQSTYTDSSYESTDGGQTWFPSSLGPVGAVAMLGNDLFVGGSNGVSISADGGQTWNLSNAGMTLFDPVLSQVTTSLGAIGSSGNTIFISGDEMYRSNDGGNTWTLIDSDAVLRYFSCLASGGSTLFAGNCTSDGRGHIYSSPDNGTNWFPAGSGLIAFNLTSLAANGSQVFAGSWNGVSRSTDNGATWTNMKTGTLIDSGVNSIATLGPNVFAGGYGIFRSTNNGVSWKSVNVGLIDTLVGPMVAVGNAIFAGAWSTSNGYYTEGGIYRSTNNGSSWVKVYSGGPAEQFAVSGNTIYATIYPSDAVVSTDNGATWNSIASQFSEYSVPNLVAAAGSNVFLGSSGASTGYGSTPYSLYRSNDRGASWYDLVNRSNYGSISALATMGTDVFAGTINSAPAPGGVFRSTDGGATWVESNAGLADTDIRAFGTSGSTLFAVTQTAGLFRSIDRGSTWTPANNGLSDSNVTAIITIGTDIFAVADSTIFRSADQGVDWTALSGGPSHQLITGLTASGSSLFASTNAGLYRSDDLGASWNALGIISPYLLSLASVGNELYAGGASDGTSSGGLFRSNDEGITWTEADSGIPPGSSVATICAMGNVLFAGGSQQQQYYDAPSSGIYRSFDQGNTWATVPVGAGIDSGGILGSGTPVTFIASGGVLYASLGYFDGCSGTYIDGSLVRSTDSGMTWTSAALGLGGNGYGPANSVNTLAANGSDLFAVWGNEYDDGGLFQSEDSGSDWYRVNSDLYPNSFGFIGKVTFVGGYFGVYRSVDSSVTWQQVNFGLQDTAVSSMATDGNRLFVATPSGVFFSNDLATRWKNMSDGLPSNAEISTLLVTGNFLYAGTANSGVWRRPLSDFPPVAAPAAVSDNTGREFAASYPNPFSGSTSILVHAPVAGWATISIVNSLGATIETVFAGPLAPGDHSVVWNARGIAPGSYECVVRMGGGMETIPLVLE